LEKAQQLFDDGLDLSEVTERLSLKKDTLRKGVKAGRLHTVLKKKRNYRPSAPRVIEV